MSAVLQSLLLNIRQHEGFPELLKAMEPSPLRPFRLTQADQVEKARAQWIYESGKIAQHETALAILTGKTPSEQEKS
jgi:hypothetical protein